MNATKNSRNEGQNIRWGWLKAMYLLTVVIAGGMGGAMILSPSAAGTYLGTSCDPSLFGIVGSVYLAFGLISILGLRDPLRFVPLLFAQLVYKSIWLVGVALPLLIQGRLPASEITTVVVYAVIVVGDAIAIPFKELLGRKSGLRVEVDLG